LSQRLFAARCSAAVFLVDFIAILFVLTINHRVTKRLRMAVRNGVKTRCHSGGTMSRGGLGIYGDESYPFCKNEAKNTARLHKMNCNNPSRCTKKPARGLTGKGMATGITTGGN
jgi:hypothetical protein